MHYMHDLKDLLCAELEDYAEKEALRRCMDALKRA